MRCQYCGATYDKNYSYCAACGKPVTKIEQYAIQNYDALVRRANKVVQEFDKYPLMPSGDLSIGFIKKVFYYNPLFVLDDLKKGLMDMLLEVTQYQYEEQQLQQIIEETYQRYERGHKERILQILIDEYKRVINGFWDSYRYYMDLRPHETQVFYYSYSIFYIARDLNYTPALLVARTALKVLEGFSCEKNTTPYMGIRSTGKMLRLSEFSEDYAVYCQLLTIIEGEIEGSGDEITKQKLRDVQKQEKKGCYVATCVYGSYDCPQVWVLRRFRDFSLAKTQIGKHFIKVYYAISPTIVKAFGENKWFKCVCRIFIDRFVNKLQSRGYENSPYDDKPY